jgi:hypothetical protein
MSRGGGDPEHEFRSYRLTWTALRTERQNRRRAAKVTQGAKIRFPNEKMLTVGLVRMRPRLGPHCWRGLLFLGPKCNKQVAKLNYRAQKYYSLLEML